MVADRCACSLRSSSTFATQERFVYRHQWRPNDLLIWHNRTVLHRAMPFDSAREKRLMVHTTIAGEAPTLSAAAERRRRERTTRHL